MRYSMVGKYFKIDTSISIEIVYHVEDVRSDLHLYMCEFSIFVTRREKARRANTLVMVR